MKTRLMHVLTPERQALLFSFIRFGIVGTSALPIDIAIVYAMRGWVGLYTAGAISYLIAATWTFTLNRTWTFRGRGTGPVWVQWLRFLGANLSGLVLNRGTYFLLITFSQTCHDNPAIAIAAGAVAGLSANFLASRRLVFRE